MEENVFERLKIENHLGQKDFWPIPRHVDEEAFLKAGFKLFKSIIRITGDRHNINSVMYCTQPDGWRYVVVNQFLVHLYDQNEQRRGWIRFIEDEGLMLEASAEMFPRYVLGSFQDQENYLVVTITDMKKNIIRELHKSDVPITSSEYGDIARVQETECARKLSKLYPSWQSTECWINDNTSFNEDIFPGA